MVTLGSWACREFIKKQSLNHDKSSAMKVDYILSKYSAFEKKRFIIDRIISIPCPSLHHFSTLCHIMHALYKLDFQIVPLSMCWQQMTLD